MRAIFKGDNASGYVEYWGYHFPCGEAVEIDTAEAIEGAQKHPEFEVEEVSDPFDHDGDGKPGGSKSKRKYTRKAKK